MHHPESHGMMTVDANVEQLAVDHQLSLYVQATQDACAAMGCAVSLRCMGQVSCEKLQLAECCMGPSKQSGVLVATTGRPEFRELEKFLSGMGRAIGKIPKAVLGTGGSKQGPAVLGTPHFFCTGVVFWTHPI